MKHTIKKGETLTSIAKEYNTTVDSIAKANNIQDKNLIYTGDVLYIPDVSSVTKTEQASYSTPSTLKVTSDDLARDASVKYNEWQNKKKPSYKGSLAGDIDKTLLQLDEREFSYDPEGDEAYLRYRDSVKSSAELALADAMGLASTLNGGYSTSYAQLAGQSAYVDALKDADEMIPKLYEAAYQRYSDETDDLEDRLDILRDLDGDEWDRYVDMLDAYNEEGEKLFDQLSQLSNEEFDRFYAMYKLSVK